MIAKLRGVLEALEKDRALVQTDGGLSYEVLLPSATVARLAGAVGKAVTLHIHHYVEAPSGGSTMIPRLAGFLGGQDKRFELLTTCKGIGPRKGLRAMALDTPTIAAAIADRDLALLQSLPEIGRRTAETIVTDLKDKVAAFVSETAFAAAATGDAAGATQPSARSSGAATIARDALEVLLQLGESRLEAVALIEQVMAQKDAPANAQDLVTRVYQLKSR